LPSPYPEQTLVTPLPTHFSVSVVGQSFVKGYPSHFLEMLEHSQDHPWIAVLHRDPNNKFDKNAIEVHVFPIPGKVGFIPAKLAVRLAPLLDQGQLWGIYQMKVTTNKVHPKYGLLIYIKKDA
jgi:HIRAN domain